VCLAKFLKVFKYKFELEYFKPIFWERKDVFADLQLLNIAKKWVRKSQIAEKDCVSK
jgi:hypothetical protein